jgi:hypothetical protein
MNALCPGGARCYDVRKVIASRAGHFKIRRMKKQSQTLMLAAALLAACGGAAPAAPTSQAADLPSFDQATVAPKPTQTPAPTATLQPTVTVAPTATKVPEPTQLPIPDKPPTPIADEAYWAKFPKDEKGRVIGGKLMPVLNYSPTMVTGKPCPRVKKWGWKQTVEPAVPMMAVAVPDDPCVLQNAIDDYVRVLFAMPAHNNPFTVDEAIEALKNDPQVSNGMLEQQVSGNLNLYQSKRQSYYICNNTRYWLIDTTPGATLVANQGGDITGEVIELRIVVATASVEPFFCQLIRYNGETSGSLELTSDQASGRVKHPANVYAGIQLIYSRSLGRWRLFGPGVLRRTEDYPNLARRLLSESAVKP